MLTALCAPGLKHTVTARRKRLNVWARLSLCAPVDARDLHFDLKFLMDSVSPLYMRAAAAADTKVGWWNYKSSLSGINCCSKTIGRRMRIK